MWRLLRPDAYTVWKDLEVRRRLEWYYKVMRNEKPAKFIICKYVDCDVNPKDLTLEELWDVHNSVTKNFDSLLKSIIKGETNLNDLARPKWSFLDVKVEIAYRILTNCHFCEHRCGVDRTKGQRGFCRLNSTTIVHTWFHHYGEEAPLIPSGTIFYGSCNLRCAFCQNYDISQENVFSGIEVTPKQLALIQTDLRKGGVRNINHVGGEPTPHLHTILASLKHLDINVPQLWNSNMYCSIETMRLLKDVIDIWLPDFKYGNNECAERLSGIKRYVDVVTRNLKIAHNSGDMIIRHLVMPNHIKCCTKPILKWISENCPRALVNIMSQYRPEYLVARYPQKYPDIARRPTVNEMQEAFNYAEKLGLCYKPVS